MYCWNHTYCLLQGLCRFASEKFDQSGENLSNNFVHLTNYSVNKHNSNYVSNTDEDQDGEGHKWSLTALRSYLREHGVDDKLLWDRIHDIVIKSIISVEPAVRAASAMYQQCKNNCFELFGFDVLIEDNLRPWLIEVNLSPSLSISSPLDRKIKAEAVADLLTIVGLHAKVPRDTGKGGKSAYRHSTGPKVQKRKPKKDRDPKTTRDGESTSKSIIDDPQFLDMVGESLTTEQRWALKSSQEELARARVGGWQCLFPTRHSITYSAYFDGPRPLNALLARMLWWNAGVEPSSAHAKAIARNHSIPFWKEETSTSRVTSGVKNWGTHTSPDTSPVHKSSRRR